MNQKRRVRKLRFATENKLELVGPLPQIIQKICAKSKCATELGQHKPFHGDSAQYREVGRLVLENRSVLFSTDFSLITKVL